MTKPRERPAPLPSPLPPAFGNLRSGRRADRELPHQDHVDQPQGSSRAHLGSLRDGPVFGAITLRGTTCPRIPMLSGALQSLSRLLHWLASRGYGTHSDAGVCPCRYPEPPHNFTRQTEQNRPRQGPTYIQLHACIHTYMHACMHACMHPYIHTYIHTYIRTYIHTYMHTYSKPHVYT